MPADQKAKILILDDEHFLLQMYRIVFERGGYEVATYDSADDALAALRAGYRPDAILFDVTMPQGKSGYEFLEIIRNEHLAAGIPKFALTNEGQEGEMRRLAELGADAHIVKAQYIPSQLANVVTELLKKWPDRKGK